jgi:hypothetical protein
VALDYGQVAFVHSSGVEFTPAVAGSPPGFSHQDEPRCLAIDAVKKNRLHDAVIGFQQVPQGVVKVSPGRVAWQVGRFVYRQNVLVFVDDGIPTADGRFGLLQGMKRQLVACAQTGVGSYPELIDQNSAFVDLTLPFFPAQILEAVAQKAHNGLSRLVRCYTNPDLSFHCQFPSA